MQAQTEIAKAPLCPEDDGSLKHSPTESALNGERYTAQVPDSLDLAARTVGAFFSGMVPNDGFPVRKDKTGRERVNSTLASCCIPNPTRAMFNVWDSIVTGVENSIRVNLLLNRAAEWVDVHSYLPVEGKVVVKVKKGKVKAIALQLQKCLRLWLVSLLLLFLW